MKNKGYETAKNGYGNVYYRKEEIRFPTKAAVKYAEYPWIACFETEGMEIIQRAE